MAKSCTICTASQPLQDRVAALAHDKVSLKKIEPIIFQEFNLKISASSIGRHLNSCLPEKAETGHIDTAPLERLTQNPTDGDTVNEALRVTLAQGVLQCHQQIIEKGDLESFRALEVLVNVQDKLYPHTQTIQESPASLREEAYRAVLDHGTVPQIAKKND